MEKPSNLSVTLKTGFVPAICCFLLLLSLPSDALLYKWIDGDGQVRYGDQLPNEYNNKKHFQLDVEGRIIVTNEAGKSPEQTRKDREQKKKEDAENALAAQKAEDERLAQKRKDRILLLTFESEDDIFYARDQRLIVLDAKISLLQINKQSSQQKLLDLDNEAMTIYLSKQLEVPGGLQQKIEQMSKNILAIDRNINASVNKRVEVETGFKTDLVRFRDLKERHRKNKNDH